MSRQILLLDQQETPWNAILREYLEDTDAQLHFFSETAKAGNLLSAGKTDLIFFNRELISLPFVQKMKLLRNQNPAVKFFDITSGGKPSPDLAPDATLPVPDSLTALQKVLAPHLSLPSVIRILSVDDQEEVGGMMEDYFENRIHPAFEFHYASGGKQALEWIEKKPYDVIILDIKMPEMDGRVVYRRMQELRIRTPVIIFFDALFDDELSEIYKYGRPAVVEKGSWTSSMPEMMALIKKLVYFS